MKDEVKRMKEEGLTPRTSAWVAANRVKLPFTKPICELIAIGDEAETELAAARDANTRLHRRCQAAESIIAKARWVENRPQGPQGRSFGRALANYAADVAWRERGEMRRHLVAALMMARELALELVSKCPDSEHMEQVREIEGQIAEIGAQAAEEEARAKSAKDEGRERS